MPRISATRQTYQFLYDFANQGGTIGNKTFLGLPIPGTAMIDNVAGVVDTPFAGGTVTDTLAVTLESAGDIQSATARNTAPWSSGGGKRHSTTATTAPILLTADRSPVLNISGSAITAGRMRLFITFIDPAS